MPSKTLNLPMPLLSDVDPDWRSAGRCVGYGAVMIGARNDELVFGAMSPAVTAAKYLCHGCPVRKTCLSVALDQEEGWDVWGGATAAERLAMCPECGNAKAPAALACPKHHRQRLARLASLAAEGEEGIAIHPASKATARTNPDCPRARGLSHASARAYRMGCRCREACTALVATRGRRTHYRASQRDIARGLRRARREASIGYVQLLFPGC